MEYDNFPINLKALKHRILEITPLLKEKIITVQENKRLNAICLLSTLELTT